MDGLLLRVANPFTDATLPPLATGGKSKSSRRLDAPSRHNFPIRRAAALLTLSLLVLAGCGGELAGVIVEKIKQAVNQVTFR